MPDVLGGDSLCLCVTKPLPASVNLKSPCLLLQAPAVFFALLVLIRCRSDRAQPLCVSSSWHTSTLSPYFLHSHTLHLLQVRIHSSIILTLLHQSLFYSSIFLLPPAVLHRSETAHFREVEKILRSFLSVFICLCMCDNYHKLESVWFSHCELYFQ